MVLPHLGPRLLRPTEHVWLAVQGPSGGDLSCGGLRGLRRRLLPSLAVEVVGCDLGYAGADGAEEMSCASGPMAFLHIGYKWADQTYRPHAIAMPSCASAGFVVRNRLPRTELEIGAAPQLLAPLIPWHACSSSPPMHRLTHRPSVDDDSRFSRCCLRGLVTIHGGV